MKARLGVSMEIIRWALMGVAMLGCVSTVARAESPVDRFLESLDGDDALPSEAKQLLRRTWADCDDCDPDEFLTQGLAVLNPRFRTGLDAYDAERYDQCAATMAALRESENTFVATHAAVYEIKALVAMDRLLDAGSRISELLGEQAVEENKVATHSYLAAETAFLRGFCLLADVQYLEAYRALSQFVDRYPDASQRLVIAAHQMLAELEARRPEELGDVCDLMAYSGRRLGHGDPGEVVQTRQQRIIELLDKLIKEAEEQESSSSSSSSSSDGSQDQGQDRQRQQQKPMPESRLPSGRAQQGELQGQRRANPGEVWGTMPPAERERILQALRDNFPSRYRRLVEQYYEELAKKP